MNYADFIESKRRSGCELKASYWQTARANLERAEYEASLPTLMDVGA